MRQVVSRSTTITSVQKVHQNEIRTCLWFWNACEAHAFCSYIFPEIYIEIEVSEPEVWYVLSLVLSYVYISCETFFGLALNELCCCRIQSVAPKGRARARTILQPEVRTEHNKSGYIPSKLPTPSTGRFGTARIEPSLFSDRCIPRWFT
jgi:hypothetical protein